VWRQVGAVLNGVPVRPVLCFASVYMTLLDTSCDGQGGSLVLLGLHRICAASGRAMSQACLVYGGSLSFGNGEVAAPFVCRQAKDRWMRCGTVEEEFAPEVLVCAVCIIFVCGSLVRIT
jgi:hypothetical protein